MANHPDLAAEQEYLDQAYAALEASRRAATRLTSMVEVGRGGTEQARYEREVILDTVVNRLQQLELGDAALCFGRIDREDPDAGGDGTESFYIGRIAVSDATQEPLIVDWRAPVAEPFYRATGRQSMGLSRRRHFATRGRTLLGIEDELFGDALAQYGLAAESGEPETAGVTGQGALFSALETARTGKLGDIVATIQGEQDEIIRSPLPGVLVVQGGPGTGKTVVALHRAAYLLYTHRFPLEGQGVLVVGPNRLFLGYIEQVLPSLGEAGVELVVLPDLVDDVRIQGYDRGLTARVKGDPRMAKFLARAVRDRELPLRSDLHVGYGLQRLTLTRERSARIVAEARRRYRRHNSGRRYVEGEVYAELALSGRDELDASEVRERLRHDISVREALEWMWPVLTPAQLLHDLYGAPSLLRHAARDLLTDDEWRSLRRPRSERVEDVVWATDDAPLLDEAKAVLGPKPRRKRPGDHDDEVRTYGHIVVDEAQDLSPMQLRMLDRRSLNGSMTIVGDIAQATGQWAHASWDEILERLPAKRPPRRAELTLGYRLPAPIMDLAARVLRHAAPDLTPPRSVREDGTAPTVRRVGPGQLSAEAVATVLAERTAVDPGQVAVICSASMVEPLCNALSNAEVPFGRATRAGLDHQVTVVEVGLVKGLEVDAAVVVEPEAIVAEEAQGERALYVALTRATKRLAVVHEAPLPACLDE
ncbi:HelD family protein [Rhabdothermincola salaria]|uniref:HelD family protein n=1 Tax=Rhabdothermincola salaria TaxID=2903142 RepID=UPI001E497DE0|nr:UvrD-helicase domain-containing protein [Rhabdothermincola salaria]MCD9624797.1 AAA family ATPase [Rhabdothermincola salaria]